MFSSQGFSRCPRGRNLFANNLPIARIGNETACNGFINDGCTDIAIDIDTSAFAIDIDGGWLERGTRIGLAVLNFLPIPSGNKNARRAAEVDGPSRACTTGCGDPVDVASGQLIDTRTDFYIPGTIPLHLTRTYDRKATGLVGRGWDSTWGRHLRVESAKTIYQDPEGVDITFHTPDDVINSANVRMPHLEMMGRKGRDVFILDRLEQLIYFFGRNDGDRILLTSIEDRNENKITFHYDTDSLIELRHSEGFAVDLMSKDDVMQVIALCDHPDGDCVVQ